MLATLKNLLKSVPGVHAALLPCAQWVRQRRVKRREQNFEGFRAVCRAIGESRPSPRFVKVGAFDGVTNDPCSDLLLANAAWTGVLAEPNPHSFTRLQEHFGDPSRFTLEKVAIGAETGSATFYVVDPSAREHLPDKWLWFEQLSSFDRDHILGHFNGELEPYIRDCEVEVLPLSDLFARNQIERLELLHIDTEGHDLTVLRTLDFERCLPDAIFLEHQHLSLEEHEAAVALLEGHGYRVRDCGNDYFALHRTAPRAWLRRAAHGA